LITAASEQRKLDMARLTGRVAIVTGGAKGIGRHYSHALANEGARVVIADIADGSDLAEEIASRHGVNSVTSAICALATSATTTVGTTGTPPVWDTISEAAGAIMIASKGAAQSVVVVLHPAQWEYIRRDLESSTGARAERREFDRLQDPAATGYQGMIGNIEIWTCDRVSVSTGDYSGLMWAAGGIGLAIVPPGAPSNDQTVAFDSPLCRVTEAYNPDDKSTRMIGELTFGASILRQELVREILSTGV
jgi:hypothetical protein